MNSASGNGIFAKAQRGAVAHTSYEAAVLSEMQASGVAREVSGAYLRVLKGGVEDWHKEVGDALARRYSLQCWSVTLYQRDWALLRKLCGVKHPREITYEDIEDELLVLRETLEKSSFDAHIKRVRSIFNSLRILKLIPADLFPEANLPKVKIHKGKPRPITEEQANHLMFNAAEPYREWFMFACLQGLRAMEVANIRGDWLEKGERLPDGLQLWNLRVQGKGDKEAVIPAHPAIVELMLAKKTQGRLYTIQAHYLSKKVNAEMRRLGVVTRNINDKTNFSRISFHSCRHFYACQVLVASGYNLLLTSRVMRHSDPKTTMIYADLVNHEEAKVINSLFLNINFTPIVAPNLMPELPQAT